MFSSLTRDKWQISQRVLQRKRSVSVLKAFTQKKKKCDDTDRNNCETNNRFPIGQLTRQTIKTCQFVFFCRFYSVLFTL